MCLCVHSHASAEPSVGGALGPFFPLPQPPVSPRCFGPLDPGAGPPSFQRCLLSGFRLEVPGQPATQWTGDPPRGLVHPQAQSTRWSRAALVCSHSGRNVVAFVPL